MTNDNALHEFIKLVQKSDNIVFFGGAGVSTASGIPDFRSAKGLYNEDNLFPPETILSHSFFLEHPDIFYDFYRQKMIYLKAKPNTAHVVLAKLEQQDKLMAVVTQNIDGLHQMAGSKRVFELHGSIYNNHCLKCHKFYGLDKITETSGVPRCTCGGVIKPDVVLYEEPLDDNIVRAAIGSIRDCDLMIVAGTSLAVYPAAGLINYYSGNKLCLINLSATPYDSMANYVIHQPIDKVFSLLDI